MKLRTDGVVVGARASAHLGWAGRHPWWELAKDDWAPYPATVYRAAGSHAGSFSPAGVDMAGDALGRRRRLGSRRRCSPADQARAGRRAASTPAPTAPWDKQVWNDPEAVITGRPGEPRGATPATPAGGPRLCLVCPGR